MLDWEVRDFWVEFATYAYNPDYETVKEAYIKTLDARFMVNSVEICPK